MGHLCQESTILSFVWVIRKPNEKAWVFHSVGLENDDSLITALRFDLSGLNDAQFIKWFSQEYFISLRKIEKNYPTATACYECRSSINREEWLDSLSDLVTAAHMQMQTLGLDVVGMDDVPDEIDQEFDLVYEKSFPQLPLMLN